MRSRSMRRTKPVKDVEESHNPGGPVMRSSAFVLLTTVSRFSVFLAGSASGFAGAAPVPKHLMKEPENTEQSKLQGKWKLESLRLGEMALPAGAAGNVELTF